MQINSTFINDLNIVQFKSHLDSRGVFSRFFCDEELRNIIGGRKILQINQSCTNNIGSIRGLHFQYAPNAEMKLVRCLKGRIWDVAVDLRFKSPTFMRWFGEELTSKNLKMMVIPEGFAHGFQVLEEGSELLYLHTAFYKPESEGGVHYDDPALAIAWPLPVTDTSSRDSSFAYLDSTFRGVVL